MQRAIGFIASLLLSPCVFAEAQVNAGLSIYWDQAALSFIDRPGSTGTVTLGDYSPFSYVYYDPAGAWTSTDPNATFSFPNGQSGLVSTDGSAGQPTMRDYAQVNGDNGWAGIQLGSTWTVNVTAPGTIWMRLPYTFTASVVGMQSWAQVTTSNLFETNFGSEPTNGDIDDHSWTASGSESRSGIFLSGISMWTRRAPIPLRLWWIPVPTSPPRCRNPKAGPCLASARWLCWHGNASTEQIARRKPENAPGSAPGARRRPRPA